ncbi:MAG: hypothetical protein ABEJ91_00715 [Candidatus Nanohaloarchaea archaeon]
MSDYFLMRPGTIFIVVLGLIIGMGVFNWSEQIFPSPESNSGTQAVDCSGISIEFVGRESNGTHHTVYIQSGQERSYAVIMNGEARNHTEIVENPARGSVEQVTAPVDSLKGMWVTVNGCSRVFRP